MVKLLYKSYIFTKYRINFILIFLAAFDYFLSSPVGDVDVKKFNEFCGVGVVVTPEEIKKTVCFFF